MHNFHTGSQLGQMRVHCTIHFKCYHEIATTAVLWKGVSLHYHPSFEIYSIDTACVPTKKKNLHASVSEYPLLLKNSLLSDTYSTTK